MYYGVDESATNQVQDDPLNIDRAEFTVDKYMGNVLKESSLNDLYKREERTKRGTMHARHVYTVLYVYTLIEVNLKTTVTRKNDCKRLMCICTHDSEFTNCK